MKKNKTVSLLLVLTMFSGCLYNSKTDVSAADFEGNEDKYYELCSSASLNSTQQKTCKEFNSYLADKSVQIKADISEGNKQLDVTKASIQEIEAKMKTLEADIAQKESEIQYLQTAISNKQNEITIKENQLKERLYVNQSQVNSNMYINFIFGASSFSDLLSRIASINDLTEYDNDLIESIKSEKAELDKQKGTLESAKSYLVVQKTEQSTLKEQLDKLYAEQAAAVAENKTALAKNQESQEAIKANLAAIEAAAEASRVQGITKVPPIKPDSSNSGNSGNSGGSNNSNNPSDDSSSDSSNSGNSGPSKDESNSGSYELGVKIANLALSKQGYMYLWGGAHTMAEIKNPNTTRFDCSGLVNWSHYQAGVNIGIHYTGSLISYGKSVSKSQLQPGDIILFSSNGNASGVHHVGIYIGDNKMVHAPSTGKPIQVADLNYSYWQKEWYSARRCY